MKRHLKLLPFILIVSIFLSLLSSTSFAGAKKIIAVKNLSATVYINKSYALPKVVVATMSNNTTQEITVKWDKKIAITSKIGTFVYKGTVKGYAKQVLLALKVVPFPKPVVTATSAPVITTSTSSGAITEPSPTSTYDDPELARAVSLGIGTYAKNEPITYKQFFQMLDVVVALTDSTVLPQWKEKFTEARISNKTMHRDEGMLAVYYTADTLGTDYCVANGDWIGLHKLIGDSAWDEFSMNYPLFPDWKQPAKLGSDTWDNHMIAAYFYSMGRISLYSDTTIFDFDSVKVSMRPADSFTYEEGLRAALRLYDSGLKVTERVPMQEDVTILYQADARRDSILSSKTAVTVQGASYYVSNSGNDNNDGCSPGTPWATIAKVNTIDFKAGDGVFFERGGVYRGILQPRSNITYSAYGEGNKPKIYGSPENGADPKKWTLLDGTKNIWVFYKDMYDTGGIVFNDGKSWATRKTGIWDGSKYVDVVDKTTPIDVKKLDNLQFFSATDYTGLTTKDAEIGWDKTGKLYLCCDEGNPGKIYNSIEFLSNPFQYKNGGGEALIKTGPNCVIDNLCIMYFNTGGIYVDSNSTVQNCEVAWVGGAITNFNGAGVGTDTAAVVRCGDGILLNGTNSSAKNNYIHHAYDNAFTIETGPWKSDDTRFAKNIIVQGNLTEASSGDMLIADWEALQSNADNKLIFENILIDDNYFMYSGYGWSHQTPDYDWGQAGQVNNGNCNIFFGYPAKAGNDIYVKNNVFYLSKYALVGGRIGGDGQKQRYQINFSGNTYAQNTGGILAEWQPLEDYRYAKKYFFNINAKKTVTDVLGDKTGVVLEP